MTALMLRANRAPAFRGRAGSGLCLAFACHYA